MAILDNNYNSFHAVQENHAQTQFATLTPLGPTILNQTCSSSLPPIQTISSSRVTGDRSQFEATSFIDKFSFELYDWSHIRDVSTTGNGSNASSSYYNDATRHSGQFIRPN